MNNHAPLILSLVQLFWMNILYWRRLLDLQILSVFCTVIDKIMPMLETNSITCLFEDGRV